MKHYRELPENYRAIKEIDAIKDKKFAVGLNLGGLVLMVIVGVIAYFFKFGSADIPAVIGFDDGNIWKFEGYLLIYIMAMIVYLVLHELTHGIAYKLMTHEQLKFGISLSCAYCGVPDIYVDRTVALVSLLAPFTVFGIVFSAITVFCEGGLALLGAAMLAAHVGGCAGDLYDTVFILSVKGELIMRDTGPKQTFYQKIDH